MVELHDAPASFTYAEAYNEARLERAALEVNGNRPPALTAAGKSQPPIKISDAAAARVESVVQSIDAAQRSLLPTFTGQMGATVLWRAQRAVNGVALLVNPSKISEIAALPGVKAVHSLIPQMPNAFQDLDFLGTRGPGGAWNKAHANGVGLHGEDLKIVVIDTGLDYVHTNFGGPGTPAAYAAVNGTTAPNPYYPTAKVPNGTDLAGDTYNASGTGPALIPMPDNDPFDGTNGHGTGCASLAAGFGVNAGGTRYVGNYDDSTPLAAMKIAPGFAPHAKIYPVRTIGAGSTTLTVPAVEWSMNPANFGGTLPDVISMSIGGPDGRPDYTSSIAFTNAANAGILCTISGGNSGNTYYVAGSASAATGVLGVSATFNDQAGFIYDATVTGNQPAAIAGKTAFGVKPSQSAAIPPAGITGEVVYARPADGGPATTPATTTPYTNAAQMSGKICLVDRGGGVSFEQKAKRAESSGAIAVLIANIPPNHIDDPPLGVGLFYNSTIPVVGISQRDGDNLKAAAAFDANGVSQSVPKANVTIANGNGVVSRPGTSGDTPASYSARGPRLGDSFLKNDIAAPAEVVGVASTLTGTGVRLFNGTSSSAPHVGGIMVLLKQLHPTWTVEELNALVMNTANHDVFTGPNTGQGAQQGLGRVGAGRVDVTGACASDVVVYNATNPKTVSLSYGVVDCIADNIGLSTRVTKNVTVKNKGTSSVSYSLSYQDVTPASDAGFQTTAPLNFTVPAGGSVNIPIDFAASGSLMKHSREASVPNAQQVSTTAIAARQWLTEKAGYAIFTPTSGGGQPVLRLPLHAVPRAVGAMHAVNKNPTASPDSGTFNIQMAGLAVNTGSNFGTNAQPGQDVVGLVKPFELQYASAKIGTNTAPNSPSELKYVGVTSDFLPRAPGSGKLATILSFVTETFGDATTPRPTNGERDIYIDANNDGTDDFVLWATSRTDPVTNGGSPTNVYQVAMAALSGPQAGLGFFNGFFVNGFPSNFRDTNTFNNSVQVYFVTAASLGYNGGPTRFKYRVESYDAPNGDLVDSTPYLTYDVANPGFQTSGPNFEPFWYTDLPGFNLPMQYSGNNVRTFSNSTKGVLLVHMHNAPGDRTEVVAFTAPSISSFAPTSGPVGTNVQINGSGFSTGIEVFFNNTQATEVTVFTNNTLQAKVPTGATTGPIKVRNAGGEDTSSTNFTVTP
jgi:subtilisin family serine protease